MDDEEKLSLVNDSDQVIGEILRGDIGTLTVGGGRYVRAVNAFIVRDDGKIWTPVRALHKKYAPGGIDYSVGAHVQAGEEYIDSLVREFSEEAGIAVTPDQCVEIIYNTPFSMKTEAVYFNKLYVVKTDQQPVLSDEHTSGSFLEISEIIDTVNKGANCKGSYLEDLATFNNYIKEQAE